MSISKQDKQGSRTVSDLERRYNFGKSFAEVLGIANDAQTYAQEAKEIAMRVEAELLEIDVVGELNASADTINLKSNGLTIESDGFSISADKGIVATHGSIGGWAMSNNSILKSNGDTLVEIASPLSAESNFLTVALLENGIVSAIPFYVKANGYLYADNADITGKITATEGEFSNCTINENCNIYGTLKTPNISAYVDEANNASAQIYYDELTGFYFKAVNQDNAMYDAEAGVRLYQSYISAYATLYSKQKDEDGISYHANVMCGKTGNLELDSSHTITLESPLIQVRSANGFDVHNSANTYSYTSIGYGEMFMRFFAVDSWAGDILMEDSTTLQLRAENGHSLSLYGNNVNYLKGTWALESGEAVTSDVNYKNSIADTPEAYSVFFDNLRPVIHKYNDGESGRYHSGFIAQEVNSALEKAGLTRQDFAGIIIANEGTEKERWSLRYTEFIPLNTLEIQKLKCRMAKLEKKLEVETNE